MTKHGGGSEGLFVFALCHSFCYYLSLSRLELRLRYMHHLGALLRVHTFHCRGRRVTVTNLGLSSSKYS